MKNCPTKKSMRLSDTKQTKCKESLTYKGSKKGYLCNHDDCFEANYSEGSGKFSSFRRTAFCEAHIPVSLGAMLAIWSIRVGQEWGWLLCALSAKGHWFHPHTGDPEWCLHNPPLPYAPLHPRYFTLCDCIIFHFSFARSQDWVVVRRKTVVWVVSFSRG